MGQPRVVSANSSLHLLGNSDLALSSLGLGAWALGGAGWKYSLGPQDDRESIAAIHCALDLGMNWIDTAPLYGFGHSEDVVRRAVRSSPHAAYIFTKCSARWGRAGHLYNSLQPASLVEEVENSLRRLGVDTIDLCQVHWPDPEDQIEEGWETLARLQQQGKIRWLGVCNFSAEQMKRVMQIAPITSLQPHYSLLRRKVETEELPLALAHDIGVINYGAMGSGLLTGCICPATVLSKLSPDDCRRKMRQFQKPWLKRNQRLVDLLCDIGAAHHVSPGVVAVAWTLHHPAVTGTIVGCRNVSEVEAVAPALHFRLTQYEYEQLDRVVTSVQWLISSICARISEVSLLLRSNTTDSP